MEILLNSIEAIGELPVDLAVVVCFLVYMWLKNGRQEKAFQKFSASIDNHTTVMTQALLENSKVVERNSRILTRHLLDNGGNRADIDRLVTE